MKLLICSPEFPPDSSGIGHVAYGVVEKLKKMDIDCTVCSPSGPHVQLGNYQFMQKTGALGLMYFWYLVSKHLKKNDYDVIWLHHDVFFLRNIPLNNILITLHTTYYGYYINKVHPRIYYKITSILEKFFLKRLQKAQFTGVSPVICDEMKEIGINTAKIKYIPNGVDTSRFYPHNNKIELRKKFGIPKDDIILLSLGRLSTQKQPQRLVEIFSLITKELKNVTLVFAGSGELLEETKELVKKKNIKKIVFLGQVDYLNDVPEIYACSDYFIIGSEYEGQPLTLLEALSSGLPCIVSDIPNISPIIKEAECGIILNFQDINKASEKIKTYLIKDNSTHSKNARNYAINNLDWNIIAKRYLAEFNNIVDSEK